MKVVDLRIYSLSDLNSLKICIALFLYKIRNSINGIVRINQTIIIFLFSNQKYVMEKLLIVTYIIITKQYFEDKNSLWPLVGRKK